MTSPARYCAPRLKEGYTAETARQKIEARTGLRTAAADAVISLHGFVDVARARAIEGWAQNPHLEAPICLDVRKR